MAGQTPDPAPAPTPVFDDGSTIYVHTPVEDGPRSGVWVDGHVDAQEVDPAEIEQGNMLGALIDVDDDEDNGGYD